MIGAAPAQAATAVTVTEADVVTTNVPTPTPSQWYKFTRDTGDASFIPGTATHRSYLQLSTVPNAPSGSPKVYLFNYALAGQPLSSLTTLAYDTLRDPASTGLESQRPAINVEIDTNGPAAGGYAVLVWELVYAAAGAGALTIGAFQDWTPSDGPGWWSPQNGPVVLGQNGALGFPSFTATLADVKAALPDATLGGIGVNHGGGNDGLVGGVSHLTVNDITYNFGAVTLTSKDQCKGEGWATSTMPVFKNQGACVSYFATKR